MKIACHLVSRSLRTNPNSYLPYPCSSYSKITRWEHVLFIFLYLPMQTVLTLWCKQAVLIVYEAGLFITPGSVHTQSWCEALRRVECQGLGLLRGSKIKTDELQSQRREVTSTEPVRSCPRSENVRIGKKWSRLRTRPLETFQERKAKEEPLRRNNQMQKENQNGVES